MIADLLVARLARLDRVTEAEVAALSGLQGEVREVGRDQLIYQAGAIIRHSLVVLDGFFSRYSILPGGERQIVGFFLPGETPLLIAFPQEERDTSLRATSAGRIGFLRDDDVAALLERHPRLARLFWKDALVQGAIGRAWLARNSRMNAQAAMAHLFCEVMVRSRLAGRIRGNACHLPWTQKMLGQALGLSIIHINRTLQALREGGLANLRDNFLYIPSLERLALSCDFNPHYLGAIDLELGAPRPEAEADEDARPAPRAPGAILPARDG